MREPPGPLWGRAASCCLLPRQISGRREACPPARRPRRELRSARRLEARPGPAGLATASNRSGCLCVAWPGPAATHRHRGQAQVLWLAYGSARQAARSSETAIAFACTCMRGIETAIAFAGAKWAFSVQFSGAKVSMVSMVAVRGASIGVVGFKALRRSALYATFSPCSAKSAREREKVRPACSKEPKIGVLWRAGRVFRGNADGGGVLGCDSGAGSRRIPPRITSGPCREPASRMEAPRALSRFVRTPHRWLLPSLGTSLTPAEDSGRRRRARPPQPRRRSSGRRPWRQRAP